MPRAREEEEDGTLPPVTGPKKIVDPLGAAVGGKHSMAAAAPAAAGARRASARTRSLDYFGGEADAVRAKLAAGGIGSAITFAVLRSNG